MVRHINVGAFRYLILVTLITEASPASVSLFGLKPLGKIESTIETHWRENARLPASSDQQNPPKAPQPMDFQTTFGMTLNTGMSDMAEVLKCSSTIDLNFWSNQIPKRIRSPLSLNISPISTKKTKVVFRGEVGMNRTFAVSWETGLILATTQNSELQLWTNRNNPRLHWTFNF